MSGKSKRPEWWFIFRTFAPAVTAVVIVLATLYLVYVFETVDVDWDSLWP